MLLTDTDKMHVSKFISNAAIDGAFCYRRGESGECSADSFLHELGHCLEIWNHPKKSNRRLLDKYFGYGKAFSKFGGNGLLAAVAESKVFAYSLAFYHQNKTDFGDLSDFISTKDFTISDYDNCLCHICLAIEFGISAPERPSQMSQVYYHHMLNKFYKEYIEQDLAAQWRDICEYFIANSSHTA